MKRGFLKTFGKYTLFIFCFFALTASVEARTQVGSDVKWTDQQSGIDYVKVTYDDGYYALIKDINWPRSNQAVLYTPQGEPVASREDARLSAVKDEIVNATGHETWYGSLASEFVRVGAGVLNLIPGASDAVNNAANGVNNVGSSATTNLTGNPGDPNRYEMATDKWSVEYWIQRAMALILKTWLQVITGALGVVGYLFDTIVTFALDNQGFEKDLGPTIDTLWKFIRDIANIVIVFSMLYLAIRTIIDGEGFADKSKLANVLLAAILINFSLFATKAAFNISNSIATQIKSQINIVETGPVAPGATTATASKNQESLSAGIARTLGVPKTVEYISDESLNGSKNLNDYQGIQFQYMLMLTLSIIGVGFILVAGALMLLYRYIMFIFLIILSPMGLVCFFIPWLKKYGQEWVDKVKALTLMAPVYFLSFYVSMLMLSQIVALGVQTQGSGFLAILVQMATQTLLIVGTLLATIMLPIKVSAAGGEFINNVGGWAQGRIRSMGNMAKNAPLNAVRGSARLAGRSVTSGAAHAGRYFVGNKLSGAIAGSEEEQKKLKALARSDNRLERWYAKGRLGAAEGLKNRTYDFRNINGVGKKLGIGEGINNYGTAVEERKKKIKDKQEKESKKYGYDKVKASEVELATARNARDLEVEKLKEHEAELKFAINNGYSPEDIQEKAKDVEEARKALEKAEKEVGKLMNMGMEQQLEKMKKKWANKMTPIRRAALKKMEEEFEKKYKEDGKAKKKKKNGSGSGGGGGTP